MKPNVETWTIVVTGGWNAQIFNPEWVGENLFETKELEIQLVFQGNNFFPSLKSPDLIFSPTNSQIVCGVSSINENVLIKAESLIIKTLRMLQHTPIYAVGINFGFSEENPSSELLDIFNFNDNVKFIDSNYSIKQNQIYRQIEIDGQTLNLRQILNEDSAEPMITHFNFHKEVLKTEIAADWLKNKFIECKAITYHLLKEIYDINIFDFGQI